MDKPCATNFHMIHHGLKLKRIHLSPYNILCVDDGDFIEMEKNLGILNGSFKNFYLCQIMSFTTLHIHIYNIQTSIEKFSHENLSKVF